MQGKNIYIIMKVKGTQVTKYSSIWEDAKETTPARVSSANPARSHMYKISIIQNYLKNLKEKTKAAFRMFIKVIQ